MRFIRNLSEKKNKIVIHRFIKFISRLSLEKKNSKYCDMILVLASVFTTNSIIGIRMKIFKLSKNPVTTPINDARRKWLL
tara:strand:+ start:177 stop:416 length:240 start_codon:yes stop_codon:yes gene_type:complete